MTIVSVCIKYHHHLCVCDPVLLLLIIYEYFHQLVQMSWKDFDGDFKIETAARISGACLMAGINAIKY
jgi:hypothetical protein